MPVHRYAFFARIVQRAQRSFLYIPGVKVKKHMDFQKDFRGLRPIISLIALIESR